MFALCWVGGEKNGVSDNNVKELKIKLGIVADALVTCANNDDALRYDQCMQLLDRLHMLTAKSQLNRFGEGCVAAAKQARRLDWLQSAFIGAFQGRE
jgi:hypothetical protein